MGMTMTQKILAKAAGLSSVQPGQLIEARLNLVLGNDITTPVAITEFEKAGFTQVFDKDRIAIVLDHYTPCKDIKAAQLCVISADVTDDAIAEDVDGELGTVISCVSSFLHVPEVIADAGDAKESSPLRQAIQNLVQGKPLLL